MLAMTVMELFMHDGREGASASYKVSLAGHCLRFLEDAKGDDDDDVGDHC